MFAFIIGIIEARNFTFVLRLLMVLVHVCCWHKVFSIGDQDRLLTVFCFDEIEFVEILLCVMLNLWAIYGTVCCIT